MRKLIAFILSFRYHVPRWGSAFRDYGVSGCRDGSTSRVTESIWHWCVKGAGHCKRPDRRYVQVEQNALVFVVVVVVVAVVVG